MGTKISGLPPIPVAPALTDLMPEVQPASGGTTYKSTLNQVLTLFMPNITQLGVQAQALNMGGFQINNGANPSSAQDFATKFYVDTTALNGTSVYAASAASLGTVTQAGAGVGATLTNAGAQATFALDGVNPPVGSNVLIKNTATGMTAANEGIYTVTNAGSGATNWVLTRATSYDTPVEINNTGLIVVNNGTTLAGSAWYNSSTIVTVDTTSFTYSKFGQSNFINQVKVSTFTSSGTYTPTTGMLYCAVDAQGGGGGGGGAAAITTGLSAGGGGGAGGRAIKTYTNTLIGANAAIVINSGGTGGIAGNNTGSTGGSVTFTPAGAGAVLTCNGGVGGSGSPERTTANIGGGGGLGGTATGGDINIEGTDGLYGFTLGTSSGSQAISGQGASSIYGSGGQATGGGGSGSSATGNGAGGAGGAASSGTPQAGGNGTNGIVIITEYISV